MNINEADEAALRVLVLVGHPAGKSFGDALADAYAAGASSSGAEVRTLRLRDLTFDPILHEGYRTSQALEPDLIRAQQDLLWARHLVLVYPVWWGSVPALLKGFLDRTLLPGFAFRHHEDGHGWDKLLEGRSAHLIATSDAPAFWVRLAYRNCDAVMLRKAVLGFCGIAPIGLTRIGGIQGSSAEYRATWIERMRSLGERQGIQKPARAAAAE